MKILVYGINYAPEVTGVGRFTGDMAAWLAAHGHRVCVVTAPPYYPHWRVADGYRDRGWFREARAEADVYRCPLYVPRQASGATRAAHLVSFAMSSLPVALTRALRMRPDLVFAVEPTIATAPAALMAARLAGARSWLHVQDLEIDAAAGLGLLPRWSADLALGLQRRLFRRFDTVSTISARMAERIAAIGVPRERIEAFPNWIDTQAIRPDVPAADLRAELGIAADAVVALYAGNMGKKQGLELIAAAAERMPADPPVNFVAAGDGAGRADLAAALKRSGADVLLLDAQPDARLPALLALADIHLLPQRAEAADLVMPSKLGGMLASGRPVVAAAAPSTQIAAAVDGCGLVVPPGDAEAFAAAIARLAGDAALCRRLGAAAREAAVRDWERTTVLGRFEAALTARCRAA